MYPSPIQNLIELFAKFPGVGPRQAARFVFHVLGETAEFRASLAKNIADIAGMLLECFRCGNVEAKKKPDDTLCSLCADKKRDQKLIAVVEDVVSLRAIEQSHAYGGLYHVLGGSIIGRKGAEVNVAPAKRLVSRIKKEKPQEIIIATSPTYEGEATARYLERELAPLNVKVTRLARGLAKGVDIEYVDEETLKEALTGRR